MQVSLNIILDKLSRYNCELGSGIPEDVSFRRFSLLPRDTSRVCVSTDCLYLCRLSDAVKYASSAEGIYCICVRDAQLSSDRTDDDTSNLIVINDDIELEDLFFDISDIFATICEWLERMHTAILSDKGIQDLITLSEPVIGNFISVSDSALSLIAYTKNISTDDDVSLFLIENGHHSEEAVRMFKEYKRYDIWMAAKDLIIGTERVISKHDVVSKVFNYNEQYFTHVVMTCNHRGLTPGLLDLFSHLGDALSYIIKHNWEREKHFNHAYNTLVSDLMSDKPVSRENVSERARIVGILPDDQYMIMLLSEGGSGIYTFPSRMAQDLLRIFSFIKPVYRSFRLMLFLHHPNLARLIEAEDVEQKLNDYFAENNIRCGASDIFSDLLIFPDAYRQAEHALQYGFQSPAHDLKWLNTPHLSNIARYHMFYAASMLDLSDDSKRLWRSSEYGNMLIELYHGDQEKHTNNLEVLYTHLKNERRAAQTAAELHMHRNNVVYRISRIEEMLGVNLDDRFVRLGLLIGFLMLRHFGAQDL